MASKNELTILTHALLSGMTLLIPIPFLDDWLKTQVQRRMVWLLVHSYGHKTSDQEISILIPEEDSGCLKGCLVGTTVYVIKKLIRQLNPILEWSRAVDTISQCYYHGYLLNYALQQGWYQPGSLRRAAQIQAAIRQARKEINTNIINQAVRRTLVGSRQFVLQTARQIGQDINRLIFRRIRAALEGIGLWLVGRKARKRIKLDPVEEKLEEIIEQAPDKQRVEFTNLLTALQSSINGEAQQVLKDLELRMAQALAQSSSDQAPVA